MTFFFDRNMGPQLPEALRLLGLDAIGHDERFGPATPDTQWLEEAGRQGWAVMTHDAGIAEKDDELAAVIAGSVPCFVLRGGNANPWGKTRELAFAWQKISTILNSDTPPYIWQRSPRGWVRLYP